MVPLRLNSGILRQDNSARGRIPNLDEPELFLSLQSLAFFISQDTVTRSELSEADAPGMDAKAEALYPRV